MIRRTDPLIAADRVAVAEARADRALDALQDVMRLLRTSAGGPAEQQAWATAREVLAESGRAGAEVAEYHAAYAEWKVRAAAREAAKRQPQTAEQVAAVIGRDTPDCQHVHPEHGGSLVFDGKCLRCGVRV